MDLLNVLSTGSLVATVNPTSSSQATTVDGAAFANQLVQLVNGQQAAGNNKVSAEQSPLLAQLVNSIPLLADEQLTGEQLDQMIEGLLDQLDQLKDSDFNSEQLELLDQLLQQLAAFVQVVTIQPDQRTLPQENALLQVLANHADSSDQQTITKLQDQLLVLQQALQDGSLKVIQGKQPEGMITQQLHQLQAALEQFTAQLKGNGGSEAQASNQLFQQVKNEADALSHLQKLAQQVTNQPSSQGQAQADDATQLQTEEQTSQPTTPITLLRADNVKDFLPQLAKTAPATPSAFVLASEFADTMKGLIVQKFDVSALNGVTEARLMLTPEHLGHVDVKITMQNGILTALFQAETAMGKDALENQMASLRASLAAQGITVEKIEVAQASFSAQLSQQQKQNSKQHLQDQGNQGSNKDENSFEEELVTNASHRELGFGRSVNETV